MLGVFQLPRIVLVGVVFVKRGYWRMRFRRVGLCAVRSIRSTSTSAEFHPRYRSQSFPSSRQARSHCGYGFTDRYCCNMMTMTAFRSVAMMAAQCGRGISLVSLSIADESDDDDDDR